MLSPSFATANINFKIVEPNRNPTKVKSVLTPMLLSALDTLLTVIQRHTKLETWEGRNLLNNQK